MAHLSLHNAYSKLINRLNRVPQGAPPSDLLYMILKMLFSEKEAELVSLLPIKPFGIKKASIIWKKNELDTYKILDALSSRGLLLDIEHNGNTEYVLPPTMAGFFEFSMMRVRKDINQKVLSELFFQYINQEEDFIKELFSKKSTQLGRILVNETVLTEENSISVLDYQRASEIIKTSPKIGIGICYCRHKMQHVGQACDAPLDICMTFNNSAASLIKHGIAKEVSEKKGLELLSKAYEHNLVQFADNVREKVNFICNCCGCCCEALLAAKKFGFMSPVHNSGFVPDIKTDKCSGCGKCVDICPVEAMSLVSSNDPKNSKKRHARINEEMCLGCGLCKKLCPLDCIDLIKTEKTIIPPLNSIHRVVLMALEKGQLQNLIFDNQLLMSHKIMGAILGVIIKLPPLKMAMATQQFKSRYLENLIKKLYV